MTVLAAQSSRARGDVTTVLAFAGSTHLSHRADIRVVGRQLRGKAHHALHRDRGRRGTVDREAEAGAYSNLPAWSHADQWLTIVETAAVAWFPEQIHRQVRTATLLKFAAMVAAHGDDDTGRHCRRVYPDLARGLAVHVETVRKCWRALERLGLAVQVERSVYFGYDERMRIWRLERSKQRGLTPEYALVVPSAYARAVETGEHPADLLALEYAGDVDQAQPVTPAAKLSAALRALRTAGPAPMLPEPVSVPAAGPVGAAAGDTAPTPVPAAGEASAPRPQAAVENRRPRSTTHLGNVDILGLPRSGPRPLYSSCLLLVGVVPHGVKSTASRAHNRSGCNDSRRPGGTHPRGPAQKRQTAGGGWFGPHRDIAVQLTSDRSRVLWLRGMEAGRIANQLKRFTVPGLPKVWRPDDFVTAFDRINLRQNRYSPGANMASRTKADQGHAERADSGAVRDPLAVLKWYLEQLDPANDHPRFDLWTEHRSADDVARAQAWAAAERQDAAERMRERRRQLAYSSAAIAWRSARESVAPSTTEIPGDVVDSASGGRPPVADWCEELASRDCCVRCGAAGTRRDELPMLLVVCDGCWVSSSSSQQGHNE